MSQYLVTFIGGDTTVVPDQFKAAECLLQGTVLHLQEMPPQEPEDWHEIDEQYLHTIAD